jgi:starch synthase (maltosyl-transferring)
VKDTPRAVAAVRRKATSRKAPKELTGRLAALAEERLAIEGVSIEIDGGRFPAKVVAGWPARIEADIFSDGHDSIDCAFVFRRTGTEAFHELPMTFVANDRWRVVATFPENAYYECSFLAWRDLFATWRKDTAKKLGAKLDIALELQEGRELIEAAIGTGGRASREDKATLRDLLKRDKALDGQEARFALLADPAVAEAMYRAGPRTNLTHYKTVPVFADREAAAFSAWYEMMPRSQSGDVTRHGTFDDVIARLPYVQDLGFDVLYFTPIHPIGRTNRKGPNNTLTPGPHDVGSPWAIGGPEGGHDAIHPDLGDIDDFDAFVARANELGLEVALDYALQATPDHPWVTAHPEWFTTLADGSIAYAENPPKKYQDIYPVNFDRDPEGLYAECLRVLRHWMDHGVRIFRVDNPHTKPVSFWAWLMEEVRKTDPDVLCACAANRSRMGQRPRPNCSRRANAGGRRHSFGFRSKSWIRPAAWEPWTALPWQPFSAPQWATCRSRTTCAAYWRTSLARCHRQNSIIRFITLRRGTGPSLPGPVVPPVRSVHIGTRPLSSCLKVQSRRLWKTCRSSLPSRRLRLRFRCSRFVTATGRLPWPCY